MQDKNRHIGASTTCFFTPKQSAKEGWPGVGGKTREIQQASGEKEEEEERHVTSLHLSTWHNISLHYCLCPSCFSTHSGTLLYNRPGCINHLRSSSFAVNKENHAYIAWEMCQTSKIHGKLHNLWAWALNEVLKLVTCFSMCQEQRCCKTKGERLVKVGCNLSTFWEIHHLHWTNWQQK